MQCNHIFPRNLIILEPNTNLEREYSGGSVWTTSSASGVTYRVIAEGFGTGSTDEIGPHERVLRHDVFRETGDKNSTRLPMSSPNPANIFGKVSCLYVMVYDHACQSMQHYGNCGRSPLIFPIATNIAKMVYVVPLQYHRSRAVSG